jgi:protein-disulfide isomerase
MPKNKPSSIPKNASKNNKARTTLGNLAAPSGKSAQRDSVDQLEIKNAKIQPKKERWFYWVGGVLILVFGLGIGWMVWGQNIFGSAGQIKIDPNLVRYDVPIVGNPSHGPENAPITLVEFSDYQCPFCTEWYKDVYPRLLSDYKDKILFVHKDFPLYAIHPDSLSAAEAANCAGEQNAYWSYHDALYNGKYGLGMSAYQNYAKDLGLNLENFNKCMSDHRYKNSVDANVTFGASLGVISTPTFFLNGMAIVGAQPYDVFKQLIDMELAGKIKK